MKKVLIVAIVVLTACMMALAQGQDKQKAAGGTVPSADSFTDPRDGKTYRTVKIGSQTWMAENLNYQTGNSWCYGDDESNCQKYGRLYDWNTAMSACPAGWRLPSRQDWKDLENAAGGNVAGKKLKSQSSWDNRKDGSSGNGTNDYGFSALPGGTRYTNGTFNNSGSSGYWWSATGYGSGDAYYRVKDSYGDFVFEDYFVKSFGLSARCVR